MTFKKSKKGQKSVGINVFSYGSGSTPLTSGSGSRRSKMIRIPQIRIQRAVYVFGSSRANLMVLIEFGSKILKKKAVGYFTCDADLLNSQSPPGLCHCQDASQE
jgi:hypothetical protein